MKCRDICTNSRVIDKADNGYPQFASDYKCIYCGHCYAVCPSDAITFSYTKIDKSYPEVYIDGQNITYQNSEINPASFENFLFSVRSERIYSDKNVEKEKIEKVVEAMMHSGTGGNEQNKHYYIFTEEIKLNTIEKMIKNYYKALLQKFNNPLAKKSTALAMSLNSENKSLTFKENYKRNLSIVNKESFFDNSDMSYLKGAKALVLITYSDKKGMHKPFYKGDIKIAGTYGILMAKALGLASCWMGLLEIVMGKDKSFAEYMGIGKNEKVGGAIILGYSDTEWIKYPPRGPSKVVWQ